MSKLTDAQLAEIAARHAKHVAWLNDESEEAAGEVPALQVCQLLAHITAVTAERDEAEANIGEVNQLLADTLSRTKSAEQRAEDAARVEREHWATWLRQQARELDAALETALVTTNAYAALHTERAVLINAADAIQRNEHKNPST